MAAIIPTKTRTAKIIWFNRPFSRNAKTNFGRAFVKLLKQRFPNSNMFNKIFNKKTVKVSCSSMKNLSSVISSHNRRLLIWLQLWNERKLTVAKPVSYTEYNFTGVMSKITQIKVPKSILILQKHPSKRGFETTARILTMNNTEKTQNYQNINGC